MQPRRAEVGRVARAVAISSREALVLRPADVGQDLAVGPRGGLGVEVDGQVEALARSARRSRARASTHSSMVVSPSGTNGITSTAPMRGCCPSCAFMSISSMALLERALHRLATRPSAGPAKVSTLRLWSRIATSDRAGERPATWRTRAAMASTTSGRRPSLKLGTHSTKSVIERESKAAGNRSDALSRGSLSLC